jgi:peptidyl-prolyl cis-trans isomerase C
MTFSSPAGLSSAQRIAVLVGAITITLSGAVSAQEETGVSIDPNVFNMYLESRIQRPAAEATPDQLAAVRNELTDIYLLSDQPRAEELKDDPRLQAQLELQSRAIMAQAVATDFLTRNQATDEEMQALYAEQIKLAPSLEFKARHILVEAQGEATTGPSGPSGGDLGWFTPDRMVAEFSNAVQALDDGAFTKIPVQTQFGWHVILREDSREAPPPPYESVLDTLKQQVEQQKLQDYLAGLRE